MFKTKSFFCLFLFVILLASNSIAQRYEQLQKEIDKILYLDAKLDLAEIPNVIIGVAIADSNYIYHYQFDEKKPIELYAESMFELGDLSKCLTGLICYWLEDKALINLQDSFLLIHPTTKEQLTFNFTLSELLSHRSGLGLRPEGFGDIEASIEDPYATFSKDDLIQYIFDQEIVEVTENKFLYSHLGYALLEVYLEQQLDQSFEQISQEFFKEIGLNSFCLTPDSFQETALVQGFNRIGNPTAAGSYPSFAASEGYYGTLEDLLALARKSWNEPEDWFKNSYDSGWEMPLSNEVQVSTGWYLHQPKKFKDVVIQSGSSAGHRSFLGFVPETKTAVVVLTNSKKGHKGLGYLILKMLNFEWKHPDGKMPKRRISTKPHQTKKFTNE